MADRTSDPIDGRFKHKRPKWVRFAKAACKDLARDVYNNAKKRGMDVSFAMNLSGSAPSSADWATGTPTSTADGSMTDLYLCLSGFLRQLEVSEMDAGVVAMMTYGLMKGKDLELLPDTWRALLQAALRMAVLSLKPEREAARTAQKLQTLVELWRPTWQRDYDAFTQRGGGAKALIAAALIAAVELQKSPKYKDSEIEWERELQKLPEEESDGEVASI